MMDNKELDSRVVLHRSSEENEQRGLETALPPGVIVGQSGEEMELSMGPQHPSTHGVIRLVLKCDGEVVSRVVPDVGYLHRSIEKIGEMGNYYSFTPYTDRVDYLAAMHANAGYAMAVEKAAGIQVPERGEYIRMIVQEFNRITSHIIALGTYALDMGAFTPFVYLLRERESINSLMEAVCGARLTYSYIVIGGVARDVPAGVTERMVEFLDHFDRVVPEFNRLITFNKLFVERLANVGVVSLDQALHYGFVGPNLRASGMSWDLRKDMPYSLYDQVEFDVPVGRGTMGQVGDSFDRYYCRVLEMQQSSRIIRQAIARLSDGPVKAKFPRKLMPPKGEYVGRVEAPRGYMMYYLQADGTDRPYRIKVRTGSFNAMTSIEPLTPGMMIADLVSYFASLDVVAPEIDR